MNRFKVTLKAFELACVNLELLHLYMNICPEVRKNWPQKVRKLGIFVRAYSWEPWKDIKSSVLEAIQDNTQSDVARLMPNR